MNDNIPIVEPTVDYTKVPPIHQRRTISFINHFIVTTISFLNNFALNCEDKLYEFENKLQKLEAAVVILESRLASVPGLDNKSTDAKNADEQSDNTSKVEDCIKLSSNNTQDFDKSIAPEVKTNDV